MKNTKQSYGDLGQHWTPYDTAKMMVSLKQNSGAVLEPSSGAGHFLRLLPDALGVEIDESVIPSDLLDRVIVGSFFDLPTTEKFLTCIGNPPYVNGKLITKEWFGEWIPRLPTTANAYLHFIDKCLDHLEFNGELIFIVPAGLLSDTSKGATLRQRMVKEGAFTHIYNTCGVEWDTAAVDTIIFRWVKGARQESVLVESGERRTLVERNGFLWLVPFNAVGFFGDFFKATVGAAPHALAIKNALPSDPVYFQGGNEIHVSEHDMYKPWPRPRLTPEIDKILFLGGPTRKRTKFRYSTASRHLDYALLPIISTVDCRKLPQKMDMWFDRYGVELGLIKAGRWSIGVKQFENCPFDQDMLNFLNGVNV
jgi:hypothetical protein